MTRTVLAVFALFLAGCEATPAVKNSARENNLPQYGDASYPTIWSRTPVGDRASLVPLSRDASTRGWSLLERGDAASALRRFNEAWSLYPRNADALWGMAIAHYERAKQNSAAHPTRSDLATLDRAVLLIEEAAMFPSPEASLLNDDAMLVMTRGGMRKLLGVDGAEADFDRAEVLLRRAEATEVHPLIYENWAELERFRGRPEMANRYALKARQLRDGPGGG